MGICSFSKYITKGGSNPSWTPPMVKIIYHDGRLAEFRQPIKASLILSRNPNCFLCNLELMYVNTQLPQVPEDEELQLDQLYFLMPLSKSQAPLCLQELCSLAIKASTALAQNGAGFVAGTQSCCRDPIGFNIIRANSPGEIIRQPKNYRLKS